MLATSTKAMVSVDGIFCLLLGIMLTGVQMKLMLALVLTMANAEAFFSFVCPHVLPTQPSKMLFTPYVPTVKTTIAK